jgi:hypothetical protein
MTSPGNATEHYEIAWRGLTVRVSYDRNAFARPGEPYHVSHLQIASAKPRGPLPMSETGYKSAFVPGGEVEANGGVVAYVTRWLDAAALKPAWKAIERDLRQGRLF